MANLVVNVISRGYDYMIPIVNCRTPLLNFSATKDHLRTWLLNSNLWIYNAATNKVVTWETFYTLYPEERPGQGGGGSLSGSGEFQADHTTTIAFQGIPAGTQITKGMTNEQVWMKLLRGYEPPSINNSSESDEMHEAGDTYGVINFMIGIHRETDPLTEIEFTLNGTVVDTQPPNEDLSEVYSYTYDTTANKGTDFTIGANVKDGTSTVSMTPINKRFSRSGFKTVTTSDTVPTTSQEIRAMTSIPDISDNETFQISIPVGSKMVVIAYPQSLGDIEYVKFVESLNIDVKLEFAKTIINVEGADGYTAIPYNVYTQIVAEPFLYQSTYDVKI